MNERSEEKRQTGPPTKALEEQRHLKNTLSNFLHQKVKPQGKQQRRVSNRRRKYLGRWLPPPCLMHYANWTGRIKSSSSKSKELFNKNHCWYFYNEIQFSLPFCISCVKCASLISMGFLSLYSPSHCISTLHLYVSGESFGCLSHHDPSRGGREGCELWRHLNSHFTTHSPLYHLGLARTPSVQVETDYMDHTSKSHSRPGSHISHDEETRNLKLEIDPLRKKLRRKEHVRGNRTPPSNLGTVRGNFL